MTKPALIRWVMVTGASGGIGRATVDTLVHAGFNVLAAARHPDRHMSTSPFVVPVELDLTDSGSIRVAAESVRGLVAGQELYGLVHAAGVAHPAVFETQPSSEIRNQLDVNVLGPLELTQHLMPSLRAARGRLVIISSVAGKFGMPFNAVHSGTKHFLEGWADSLRVELDRSGIRIVVIEPGAIRTSMIDKFRRSISENLAQLTPELRPLYVSPLTRLSEALAAHIEHGSPPQVVSDAVARALLAARPKTRYPVGAGAGRLTFLARLLPDHAKDRLLTRFFDLPAGAHAPAAAIDQVPQTTQTL